MLKAEGSSTARVMFHSTENPSGNGGRVRVDTLDAPANLAAAAASNTTISLTWADVTDAETGFAIDRSTSGTFAAGTVTTLNAAADAQSYLDTGLSADTTYYYRVRATNVTGASPNSASASAATANVTTAPAPVVGDAYAQNGTNAATAFGSTDPGRLVVKDSTTSNSDRESFITFDVSGAGGGPVASATLRLWGVVADSEFPADVGVYAVADTTWDENTLTWNNRPTVGTLLDTTTIDVNWKPNGAWFEWDATAYVNQQLAAGKTRVSLALKSPTANGIRVDFNSDEAAADRPQLVLGQAQPQQPPAAPSNLAATAASHSRIDLAWTDNANNETGFHVQRSADGGVTWTLAAIFVEPDITTSSDFNVAPGTTYTYRVRAYNAHGDSAWSATATATTPADPNGSPPPAPTGLQAEARSPTSIRLSWQDNAGNEEVYLVEQSWDGVEWAQVSVEPTGAEAVTLSDLSHGTRYYFRVRAANAAGPSAYSNVADATTELPAPETLHGVPVRTSELNLTWQDVAEGEDGFHVDRSTDGGTTFSRIATVAPNAEGVAVIGLEADTQYAFRIAAFKGAVVSEYEVSSVVETPADDGVHQGYVTHDGGTEEPQAFWSGANGQHTSDLDAGLYRVDYASGSMDYTNHPGTGWDDPEDLTVNHSPGFYFGVLYQGEFGEDEVVAPGTWGHYPTEPQVEQASAGQSVTFRHAGGTIGIRLHDYETTNNEGSVTWRLMKLPDLPTISIETTKADGSEVGTDDEARKIKFTVRRAGADLSMHTTVEFHPWAGTATMGADYDQPHVLTFAPGETEKVIEILPEKDSSGEDAETVTPLLKASGTSTLSVVTTSAGRIGLGQQVWVRVFSNATEGNKLRYQVFRRGDELPEITIPIEISGWATRGVDYQNWPAELTFEAGADVALLTVESVQDTDVEFSEAVILTLDERPEYEVVEVPTHLRGGSIAFDLTHKRGSARAYLDDDDVGPMTGRSYPNGTPMNTLRVDSDEATAGADENCMSWALNTSGQGNSGEIIALKDVAVKHGLFDEEDLPVIEKEHLMADAAMLKRVIEAFLYDDGDHVQGYRCYFNDKPDFVPATLTGWHMITAYFRNDLRTRLSPDYHFATYDYDPVTTVWSWSDKEGADDATNTDPYAERGAFLGHFMINRAPRDARAT